MPSRVSLARVVSLAAFALPFPASAQPFNRAISPADIHYTDQGPVNGAGVPQGMITGMPRFVVAPGVPPRDLSYQLTVRVNGLPLNPSTADPPVGGGTVTRLIMGQGIPVPGPGGGTLFDCNIFCVTFCLDGVCTWGLIGNAVCMCANQVVGGPVWVGRFGVPTPPLHPGDVITVEIAPLPGWPEALPEIDTSDDLAAITIGEPCGLADLCGIGGSVENPIPPDLQLTVDDLIYFVNAYVDATGCPSPGPVLGRCNGADLAGVGGPPEPPDGQLTVDDLIAFVNAFSEGC